jgi:hypothetical protein
MTSLCYEESQVGHVLLLLGILIGSIEFYKKGFVHPGVFIKKVFTRVMSKFENSTCDNLMGATQLVVSKKCFCES